MAVVLASRRRNASACMRSGKRMGKESVCILTMSHSCGAGCCVCFLEHVPGTLQKCLLFARAPAIESTGKGRNDGQQIFGQFVVTRLLFVRMQDRERNSIPCKQGWQIEDPKPRQAHDARDENYC